MAITVLQTAPKAENFSHISTVEVVFKEFIMRHMMRDGNICFQATLGKFIRNIVIFFRAILFIDFVDAVAVIHTTAD